jgi:hypothetical protein
VGAGHVLPVILLMSYLSGRYFHADGTSDFVNFIIIMAGLTSIAGGWSQKAGILLESGYYREIHMLYDVIDERDSQGNRV